MTQQVDIAVLGSVNLDFVVTSPTLPTPGETVSGGTFFTTPGGKGGNQALAAQRLGAQVQLHACLGRDAYAQSSLENLIASGVNVDHVLYRGDGATGAAFINVDDAGENQIAVAPGTNALFTAALAPTVQADWIITQLEIAPDTILKAAEKSNAKLCINAAPVKPLPQALIDRADLLIVNEIEFKSYEAQFRRASGLIALTLGSKGAKLLRGGQVIASADAPSVDVVDTTGAGDCFVAALTMFLGEGMEEMAALKAACHCGALATTGLGAQAASPTRQQLADAFPELQI